MAREITQKQCMICYLTNASFSYPPVIHNFNFDFKISRYEKSEKHQIY